MTKIAIIFGTDTGNTRRIAKQIGKLLGPDRSLPPTNIAKLTLAEFVGYDRLILGTPTYGQGVLPGLATGALQPSWAEFVDQLAGTDLRGKRIALFGLGDQTKYGDHFVDGLERLYRPLTDCGAELIGESPDEGYHYSASAACHNGRFVGLPLDQDNQKELTDARLQAWIEQLLAQGIAS